MKDTFSKICLLLILLSILSLMIIPDMIIQGAFDVQP